MLCCGGQASAVSAVSLSVCEGGGGAGPNFMALASVYGCSELCAYATACVFQGLAADFGFCTCVLHFSRY